MQAKPGKTGASSRWLFPALAPRSGARPLVYLDSAATALKPAAVIAAQAEAAGLAHGGIHRSVHALAAAATAAYEGCRERVGAWLGAPAAGVVFTRNATAALNLAAAGIAPSLPAGAEILLTGMEHHANLVPWLLAARRHGLTLRRIPLTPAGELDLAAGRRLLGPATRVVALTLVSNVLGTVNPVAEIAAEARRRGALVVVDAAQAVGHRPVDLAALGADLLAFSAHKCYGPSGLGFLAGRPEAMARLEPLEGGGEMISRVDWDRVAFAEVPRRFEAGTPNGPAAAAFPAAIDLLEGFGLEAVRRHEEELAGLLLEGLAAIPGMRVLGPPDPRRRGGLVAFHHPAVHPHDVATFLDHEGIAVRAGHHCAQPLHRDLGLQASTRASFGLYNDRDDVAALLAALRSCLEYFER